MSDFDKRFPPVPPVPPVPPPPVPPHRHYPHPKPFPHRHRKPMNHEADFAPMIMHPHIPHHFNFWCNKVIPLVYDDSLSYYEVLAKTVDYLNHVINDVKMGAINIEELAESFCELQRFVNDYFAWYQSKGLINYEIAITNDNYEKYLPDLDVAQMNTVYRFKFVEGSEQTLPDNLPDAAKPFSGAECVLFNLSNFQLKRVGNQWCEITNDDKDYSTANNYQLFITDKDIYFRENSGDSWGEWSSIFANWWSSEFENVKAWVREYVTPLVNDLSARIAAEVARATAAEQALDGKIEAETARATAAEQAETDRATAAENALSQRLVAEYERAAARENELEQAIEDETDRAEQVEGNLQTAIQQETTRATNAEGAIRTDLNAEITRATARENEISGDIADVARDLSEEIVDRQQGDENLQNNIDDVAADLASEVTRAQGAESDLAGDIANVASDLADEVARAQGAESGITQMVQNGYIPNAGNSLTGTTTVIDRSSLTLRSFNTTLSTGMNGAPNSYIQLQPSMITVDSNAGSGNEGISGKIQIDTSRVDISHGNAGGYVGFKVGSSTTASDNTTLYLYGRNGNPSVVMHGSNSSGSFDFTQSPTGFNVTGMGGNSYYVANLAYNSANIAASNYGCFNISATQTTITQGTASVTATPTGCKIYLTNGTAYLHKAGESESIPNAPYELVRKADIAGLAPSSALQGYIPNAGNNDINIDFTLLRGQITLRTDANDTAPQIHIDGDGVDITGDNENTWINIGQTDTDDVEIHAEDGAVKFVTDNIMLQAADTDVTIGGDTDIKVYAGDTHDLTIESTNYTEIKGETGVIINAPNATIPALYFSTDYDVNWFNAPATLNVHGSSISEWNTFVDEVFSYNGGVTKFVFDIANKTINVAANTEITNSFSDTDFDNVLRFVNCTFNITNGNAIIGVEGGHIEFENCRFVAPSYVNNKVSVSGYAYAVFKNCTFENVDVECRTTETTSVFIAENCYCSHTLFLEPNTNPTAPFKIVNSYFDSNTFTIPTGETAINAIVTGCRFGTGATLTEIRYHWGNTNIGD